MTTPQQRTLNWLHKLGYRTAVVEKWIPVFDKETQRPKWPGVKKDAFGFTDIIAVHPARPGTTYVQATSASNVAARIKKIMEIDDARIVCMAGNTILVVGWEVPKGGGRGKIRLVRLSWTGTEWQKTSDPFALSPLGLSA